MAVLLMNNGDSPTTLSFAYADVPGVFNATTSCAVCDVWARAASAASAAGSLRGIRSRRALGIPDARRVPIAHE